MSKVNIFGYFSSGRPLKVFNDKIWLDNNRVIHWNYKFFFDAVLPILKITNSNLPENTYTCFF